MTIKEQIERFVAFTKNRRISASDKSELFGMVDRLHNDLKTKPVVLDDFSTMSPKGLKLLAEGLCGLTMDVLNEE